MLSTDFRRTKSINKPESKSVSQTNSIAALSTHVFEYIPNSVKSFDTPGKNPTEPIYPIFGTKETNVQAFLDKIATLPQNDPPEVFGLNAIADVKLRRDQANEIFQKIIDIQPKESAVGGMTREDVVMKNCQELLPQVPPDFNMELVRKLAETIADSQPKPTNVSANQEIERMQLVLRVLRSTLTYLCLAIDGSIVMNDQLYNAMNSLFDGRIPAHWTKISCGNSTRSTRDIISTQRGV